MTCSRIFDINTRGDYDKELAITMARGFVIPYSGSYGQRLADSFFDFCFERMLPRVRILKSRKRGGGFEYAVFAEVLRRQLPSLPNSTRREAFYGEKLTLEEASAVAKSVVDSISPSNGSK